MKLKQDKMSILKFNITTSLKMTLLFFCLVFIASCKRNNDPIGPAYKAASSDFKLLTALQATNPAVNFSIGETESFTAEFSQEVTWTLNLKGLRSGATKMFTGLSDKLDVSNNVWTGKHDGLYFFRSSEQVVATLTLLGSKLFFTDTINIVYSRSWDIPGEIVTAFTFEKLALSSSGGANSKIRSQGGWSTGYTFFDGPFTDYPTYKATFPTGSDMITAKNNEIESILRDINGDTITTEIAGSVEGDRFYRMAGQDGIYTSTGYSDYFIGGCGLPSAAVGHLYDIDSNASNVYFNIYVYGTGDPNSKLVVNFDEDDNRNGVPDSGVPSDNYAVYEDEYAWAIQVDWVGWKLVSTKYSDLPLSADGVNARKKMGNGILQPQLISKIGLVLLSSAKGGKASVIFDFATFTMGKPFNPND